MNATVCLTSPARNDYEWQLAALNDRLMNRPKYAALGENVDMVVNRLQRWLMEYDNNHPKREVYKGEVKQNMTVLPIRFYREQKGMTQAELGAAVGISEQDIEAFESGLKSPTLRDALAIADALDVSPYELAKGAEEQ